MKASRHSLAEQHRHLLERIAAERGAMAASLVIWRQPLAVLDLGCSLGRFVRAHPLAVASGFVLARLALPKPLRRVARWWWYGSQLASLLLRPSACRA